MKQVEDYMHHSMDFVELSNQNKWREYDQAKVKNKQENG
jgi:hypothetical protein